jgi:colicin import membrane protein
VKETPKAVEQPVVKQPDIALEQEKKRKEQKAREEKAREEKAREEEARKAELLKKQELAKKEAADKKRKEQEDQKRLDKVRDETMRRMLAQAGPGAPGSTGDAAKTQGPRGSAEWAGRVKGKIISNIVFPPSDNVPGNPTVEYDVDLLPDGSVAGIRKTKSSGIPAFDEAVKSAIMKSQPYPKDKSGGVPQQFHGVHGLKDQ